MGKYEVTIQIETPEEALLEKISPAEWNDIQSKLSTTLCDALKDYCFPAQCTARICRDYMLSQQRKIQKFVQSVRDSCNWCFGCRYAATCSQDSNFCNSENDNYEMQDY